MRGSSSNRQPVTSRTPRDVQPERLRPLVIVAGATILGLISVRVVARLRQRWLIATVRGLSMTPTFADGDRVLVDRSPRRPLRHGQVLLLDHVEEVSGEVERYVKRIVALPGDAMPADVPSPSVDDDDRVPPGHVVLKGDFAYSLDSRDWGPVPIGMVLGVVRTRLRPERPHG